MITQDMAFAAFLVHQGHPITRVHRNGRRVSWEFSLTEEDLDRVDSLWPSSQESKFFNVYTTLKNQIRK